MTTLATIYPRTKCLLTLIPFFAELGPTLARAIPLVADVVSTQIYALVKSYENELHPECSIPVMTLE